MRLEDIGGGLAVAQTPDFCFGTDALVLAAFGAPQKAGEKVCDLGTGCGIIPFILQTRPHPPAYTLGVDIQAEAIALCQTAKTQNGTKTIEFLQADWRDYADMLPMGQFDRVLCNPPYFPKGSGKQNDSPARKIARHADENTLPCMCKAAAWTLRYGGKLCVCHRPSQLPDLFAAMRQNGLEPKRMRLVQQRAEAAPFLVLVEAVKGGKEGLDVAVPWQLTDPQTHAYIYGAYSR